MIKVIMDAVVAVQHTSGIDRSDHTTTRRSRHSYLKAFSNEDTSLAGLVGGGREQ